MSACSWGGLAIIGGGAELACKGFKDSTITWIKSGRMNSRGTALQVLAHEMGHNLGLHHSSSRSFTGEPLGPIGSKSKISEYGGRLSTMGAMNSGFYSAHDSAERLGWLQPNKQYQTIQTSGTYMIQPYETRPANGIKALRIRRGSSNEAWLWVESRRPVAPYHSNLDPSTFNGVTIHYQDAITGMKTHLIDFTKETTSFKDSALPAGTTWVDPYSNLSITVDSVDDNGAVITVNYSEVPCTPTPPTFAVNPAEATIRIGRAGWFSISIQNNDSPGCIPRSYVPIIELPIGWGKLLSPDSIAVEPGKTGVINLGVQVPGGVNLGDIFLPLQLQSKTEGLVPLSALKITVAP
jgi:hypothetical protein